MHAIQLTESAVASDPVAVYTVGELAVIKSEIVSHFTRSMESLAKCGALLKVAHDALADERQFRGFCQSLPFTYRSAYNYMRLYEHSLSIGIETMLESKVDATAWYKIPVDSEASTIALERAKEGVKVTADVARMIVQEAGIENQQTAQVLEQVAQQNPKMFADAIARGAVNDPVSGDDIPLRGADASMVGYAASQDEKERIHRQRDYIDQSKLKRFSDSITFFVEGQPIPKGRPRFNTNTKHAYTDERTTAWENTVGWEAKAAMQDTEVFIGDCSFSATFYRAGHQRADLDNLIKAVKDGMNGIVYSDDSRVIEYGRVRVLYGSDKPGVEITVGLLAQAKALAA